MTKSVRPFATGQMVGARERQEDECAAQDLGDDRRQRFLFVVADGMGGHEGAAAVAQLGVRRFCEIACTGHDPLPRRLHPALIGANNAIALAAIQDLSLEGAGCAFLSAAVEDGALSWISVGDCSLLLFRRGRLKQLNEDHSMRPVLNQMAAAGRLSSKAAYEHPRRRSLRSALTGKEIRLIDRSPEPLPLAPGDAVILASDGLETLGRRGIGRILKRASHLGPATIVTRLLDGVGNARNPHQDNVTIIAYRVTQEADARRAGPKAGMGRFLPWLMLAGVLIAAALFGLHVVPF